MKKILEERSLKMNIENTKQEPFTVKEYYLNRDIVRICEVFSSRVLHTNVDEYFNRNQTDTTKIWNDIFYGKLAEWGVYFIYLERGRTNIDPPDMRVYQPDKKSFDADLRYGLYNLHVKSQNYKSAVRYGDSWILQSKDPLFGYASEYDILIGCRVTTDENSKDFIEGALVEIQLEKPFNKLKISKPKLSKFNGTKKAVYLKDNNE
jgi:hypothetical protein